MLLSATTKPKLLINIKINSSDHAKTQVHTFFNTICRLIAQTIVKICEIIILDRIIFAFLYYAVQSQKQNWASVWSFYV